ncbi:uncharacterized protein LOC118426676 [Branchiostoma floridae]|uniref:Uncharacterized protein LOC118426676 n=1 Tax=Branchiostoma floridae TaxID=7739 RepID=A0A9J7N6V6_BRAFL|nr:uncharacterized protein LOC118426676 [Branchiostoma floridae]
MVLGVAFCWGKDDLPGSRMNTVFCDLVDVLTPYCHRTDWDHNSGAVGFPSLQPAQVVTGYSEHTSIVPHLIWNYSTPPVYEILVPRDKGEAVFSGYGAVVRPPPTPAPDNNRIKDCDGRPPAPTSSRKSWATTDAVWTEPTGNRAEGCSVYTTVHQESSARHAVQTSTGRWHAG